MTNLLLISQIIWNNLLVKNDRIIDFIHFIHRFFPNHKNLALLFTTKNILNNFEKTNIRNNMFVK